MESTYKETVDWLFQQFPSYQQKGASAYKPGLNNVLELMDILAIDYKQLNYIHVAGTNGKGSTCAFLASILTESSEKVGLFTSPHIKDFRERIRVNGMMIPQKDVIAFIHAFKDKNTTLSPSFFELTFALAIQHFINEECSIVVLETGLGGRLDATNIVTPILSIITSIGLDHQNFLGDTRAKIAFEKAGIIKEHVPVLIGEKDEETELVFRLKAKEVNAPIIFLEEKWEDYLVHNKAIALKALELIKENRFNINDKSIELGTQNLYKNTGLIGRMQVISNSPLTLIDAAHNEDGVRKLVNLISNKYQDVQIHVVFGSSSDKNHKEIFSLLPKKWRYYFTTFPNERSMSIEKLNEWGDYFQLDAKYFSNPNIALSVAQDAVSERDVVVCFGSFFLLENFF